MSKNIHFISVPLDLGANMEGTSGGPQVLHQYLRESGFWKKNHLNGKESQVPVPKRSENSKHKEEITEVCGTLRDRVRKAHEEKELPVTFGGDHSLAIGSIFGSSHYCYEKGLKLGVLWLDAHADMNTPESSETGNIHGMPLATVLGMGHESLTSLRGRAPFIQSEDVYLAGIRDVDEKEQVILDKSGVTYATMARMKEIGMKEILPEIEKVISQVDCVHLSLDLDVMDPLLAPSVSTPVEKGMTLEEMSSILNLLKRSCKLLSADFVEYNPLKEIDKKGLSTSEAILSLLV